MLSEEDQLFIQNACDNNPDIRYIVTKLEEEQQLVLSKLSHELKNPIAILKSTIQLMETQNPSLHQMKYWDNLHIDLDYILSLLQDIIEYNRQNQLHKCNINLLDIMEEIKTSFQPSAIEKNVALTITVDSKAVEQLTNYYGDRIKLKQVFTNLVKNALEATQSGGYISIVVSLNEDELTIYDLEPKSISISIVDNGTPIPDQMLEHIFEPYVTTKPCGSGLGLPIADRIIRSHNGTLTVTSSQTQTQFSILLPISNMEA